ncbi:hypothetical protein EVAR_66741_1 [Eumeta japonica]|uniref:Uncharacterized protein n=1 Tax=Eumeta variegata TaxID=151549 RepID=A0A4C1SLG4_EUMVA|nr:hypothetical protein EVAR_66741_1 [Eumeta japonica]
MPERKHQSSVRMFESNSKPTKLRQARSVGKKNFSFSNTGSVCTIPLEEQKKVNAGVYHLFAQCLRKIEGKTTKMSHPIAPRQCFSAHRE